MAGFNRQTGAHTWEQYHKKINTLLNTERINLKKEYVTEFKKYATQLSAYDNKTIPKEPLPWQVYLALKIYRGCQLKINLSKFIEELHNNPDAKNKPLLLPIMEDLLNNDRSSGDVMFIKNAFEKIKVYIEKNAPNQMVKLDDIIRFSKKNNLTDRSPVIKGAKNLEEIMLPERETLMAEIVRGFVVNNPDFLSQDLVSDQGSEIVSPVASPEGSEQSSEETQPVILLDASEHSS